MESSSQHKKNFPPLSWINLLIAKLNSSVATLALFIQESALTLESWDKKSENQFKIIMLSIMKQWEYPPSVENQQNLFKRRPSTEDIDHLEFPSLLQDMMKMDHTQLNQTHLEHFIIGRQQQLEREQRMQKHFCKKDTSLICRQKMLFTQH